jgi:hypothetical protein
MDAGYGNHCDLRTAVTALELPYIAGILSNTTVWAPGMGPLPPKPSAAGRGRPAKRLRRDADNRPVKVKDLAMSLSPKAWETIIPAFAGTGSGGKARMRRSHRVLHACGSVSPGATASAANPGRKNGCSWNGLRVKRSRRNTGSPRYVKAPLERCACSRANIAKALGYPTQAQHPLLAPRANVSVYFPATSFFLQRPSKRLEMIAPPANRLSPNSQNTNSPVVTTLAIFSSLSCSRTRLSRFTMPS